MGHQFYFLLKINLYKWILPHTIFQFILLNKDTEQRHRETESGFPYCLMKFKCADLLTMMYMSNDFKITFAC